MDKELMAELVKALKRVRNPVIRERFATMAKTLAPKDGPTNVKAIRSLIKVIRQTN